MLIKFPYLDLCDIAASHRQTSSFSGGRPLAKYEVPMIFGNPLGYLAYKQFFVAYKFRFLQCKGQLTHKRIRSTNPYE